jgi:hypothetical protein
VTFDHLHVQDLRRGLVGEGGRPPLYPNAKLLVNRRELETLQHIHPLQAAVVDLAGRSTGCRPSGSSRSRARCGWARGWRWCGRRGTRSATIRSSSTRRTGGVYAISENAVAPECYLPAASKIRALRAYARTYDAEVVLNGNALESALSQYTAMVLEKALVDRGAGGG